MVSSRGIRAGAAYVELYASDSKLVRGLKRAQKRLKAFGTAAREIGSKLAKVSAVFATPFLAGAKVFADFEQQMANVATMLDNPEKHMKRFRKAIRTMSVEFGESTGALAGGLYDILSASIPADKALAVLTASVKAAKAGMTDTKTAADAITTVLNSYGLSGEHAADVSDLLFAIVKRGKTTFAELAPAIGMVASTAANAGVGLDEMGAVLATLTRNGIRTENAVTALNRVVATFLKPSDDAAKYAKELGFELSSATLKSEGLVGVFRRISKLPPDAIARLFPNIRALRGVIPALKNLKGFEKDIRLMAKRAGSTETAYRKMTKTLTHSFNQLKQAAMVALSSVGEALAQPLARASKSIRRYLGLLAEWIQKNPEVVKTVLKVIAAIGATGVALIALGTAASALRSVFGVVAAVITGVGTAIGILGSVLAGILSPIGAVIAAVVTLGAYILHATGAGAKALTWLGERFQALKQDAAKAFQGISDALAAGDIGLAAKVLWLTLKKWWKQGVNWLTDIWLDFKFTIVRVLTEAFYGALSALTIAWASLQKAWVHSVSFLKQVWANFTAGIRAAWEVTQNWLAKRFIELQGALDSSLDVEAAKKGLDAASRRKLAAIGLELQAGEKKIARKKKERLQAVRKEETGILSEIARRADAAKKRQAGEYAADLQKSEADLAKAKQEWRDAIAAAKKKRLSAETAGKGPGKTTAKPKLDAVDVLDKLQKKLARAGDAVALGLKRTVSVRGTFNAAAIRGLLAGNAAERTARATEETAKNTKRLVNEAQRGGLTFA